MNPTGEHDAHRRVMPGRQRRPSGARSQAHMELLPDEPRVQPRSAQQLLSDAAKRIVDVIGAIVLLALLSPLFVLVAIAIKLDSRGPVLFAHRRLGKDGNHFDCYKFRTMEMDAEHRVFDDEKLRHHYVSNDFKIPFELDPRITRLGKFLRPSSLDELPQLLNVLMGQMSLVGPRPIVALEATHYGDRLPLLLSVRPGVTGPWAVGGRTHLKYPARADVELEYVNSRSLSKDMLILLRTPWAVLTQRGAI